MDETGFQHGQRQSGTITTGKAECQTNVAKSNSTDWSSAVECVDADGALLKPMIIQQGKEPRTDWFVEDSYQEEIGNWVFAYSSKGWTDNELSVLWLTECFIPQAIARRRSSHSLLILDNHGSHCTGEFIYHCFKNNIILFFIPPHTSHILQPLDLGPFAPLERLYTAALAKHTPSGAAKIDRAQFVRLYVAAREQAFSRQYIRAGWQRSGFMPFNKDRILANPTVVAASRATPDAEDLPSTSRSQRPRIGRPQTPPNQLDNSVSTAISTGIDLRQVANAHRHNATPRSRRQYRWFVHQALSNQAAARRYQYELRQLRQDNITTASKERQTKLRLGHNQRSIAFSKACRRRQPPDLHSHPTTTADSGDRTCI